MKRRLSDSDFEKIMKRINTSTTDTKELVSRRDFLLDLADMMKDPSDVAKYRVWAGQLDSEIKSKSNVR